MEVGQVPIMLLSGQCDGALLPLLSICRHWLPTCKTNYLLFCVFDFFALFIDTVLCKMIFFAKSFLCLLLVCLVAQGQALVAGEGDRCCYCGGTIKQ